ncbi:MAG: hypothetical protein AAF717_16500 [Bacteroidota bacterium]
MQLKIPATSNKEGRIFNTILLLQPVVVRWRKESKPGAMANTLKDKLTASNRHIAKTVSSSIGISGTPEIVWDNITNVRIEQFSDPVIFKLLGIPRPLRAELLTKGAGGQRIAYFNTGKRFVQEITTWKPLQEYSFNFNPEKGFTVGYFFDISDGIFRVPNGAYFLEEKGDEIALHLSTTYSLDKRVYYLFTIPVRIILKAFQQYLLRSIKKNSE